MSLRIKKLRAHSRHRNGVSGEPFEVVIFEDEGESGSLKVAVLFDHPGATAVLDVAKLAAGDVAFGSNSWRGDLYRKPLVQALTEAEA